MLASIVALTILCGPGDRDAARSRPPVTSTVWLRMVDGVSTDPDRLANAIELRLPGTDVVVLSKTVAGKPDAVLEIESVEGGVRIRVEMADGRQYRREVEVTADLAERTIAAEVAVLLRGAQDGSLTPEPRDAPPVPDPRPQIGVRFAAGPLLGVVPTGDVAAALAGGGEIGMDVVGRVPVLGTLGLRFVGRSRDGIGMFRIRVALGVGYRVRRAAFEMPIAVLASVEPWRVEGRDRLVRSDGTRVRFRPLLGAGVRVAPGYRHRFSGKRPLDLRVGGFVDASVSAMIDDGFVVPRVRRQPDGGEVLFRPGGFELGLGVEVALWFDLGR